MDTAAQPAAGNLPSWRTPLVGRREELARVRDSCPRLPLVTVTGPGGVGKTCLAQHAAAVLAPRFPDGVWWVGLSALRDGTLLGHAIAEALPLADQSTRPVIEVLGDYLAERRLLLVLDTCEHLVDACAFTAELLLRAAPGLRILTTSRRPLGMLAEEVLTLEPLPVPEAGDPDAGRADAVELLVRRAAEAGFEITGGDWDELVSLARRLEGLPLAIELAAARLREWTPAELTERLADRFAVLGECGGAEQEAADPPWHRSLRCAVGWSHQLCSPAQRLLWARLSVFAGGFDAEAARRVCADARLPGECVPALLAELVDKSIAVWAPTGGGERYRMLDTVREYGLGWLRRLGEEREVRKRQLAHCTALARRADAAWIGPEQLVWRDRMVAEHANLRTALDFCLAEGDGAAAQELGGALWFLWFASGFARDGRHYLDLALGLPPASGPAYGKALWARGLVAVATGEAAALTRLAVRFRAYAAHAGDESALAAAAYLDMGGHVLSGEMALAARAAGTSPPALPAGGRYPEGWFLAVACGAFACIHVGEFTRAAAQADAVCGEAARRGDVWARSWGEYMRALAAMGLGRAADAETHARAALEGNSRLRDSPGIATAVDLLACAAAAGGHGGRAARLLGVGERIWRTLGVAQMGIPELVASRRACEERARRLIGDEAYDTGFGIGRGTDAAAGLAYALGSGEGAPQGSPPD